MRATPYDLKAPKQTVSLTINSDLYAQVKSLGINSSQVAEEALAYEVDRRRRETLTADIQKDMEALDAYEAKHGSFADMARAHYQSASDGEDGR